jgi:hypothetical protein
MSPRVNRLMKHWVAPFLGAFSLVWLLNGGPFGISLYHITALVSG